MSKQRGQKECGDFKVLQLLPKSAEEEAGRRRRGERRFRC